MPKKQTSIAPIKSYLTAVKRGKQEFSYDRFKQLKLPKKAISAIRQIVVLAKQDEAVDILYKLSSYSMTLQDFAKKVEVTAEQSQLSFEFAF